MNANTESLYASVVALSVTRLFVSLNALLLVRRRQTMDNKDVEGAIEWTTEFIAKLADGISSFLGLLPDVVIGGIAAILLLVWVWKKVND